MFAIFIFSSILKNYSSAILSVYVFFIIPQCVEETFSFPLILQGHFPMYIVTIRDTADGVLRDLPWASVQQDDRIHHSVRVSRTAGCSE